VTAPGSIPDRSTSLHLSHDETDAIAADLARVWPGMIGQGAAPHPDMLAELVQRAMRKAREAIAIRSATRLQS
jgi:hypothetical protein